MDFVNARVHPRTRLMISEGRGKFAVLTVKRDAGIVVRSKVAPMTGWQRREGVSSPASVC